MFNSIKTISSIELENFKGYRLPESGKAKAFDMTVDGQDADIILVTGKNGVGKTSLLEAMDWILNQSAIGAGDFITTGQRNGAVRINGDRSELQGRSKTDRLKLNTVASFFYQENIAELACNEIIQLLEPENKPAAEIKQGLKSLQEQLENWQRQLHTLKYRKNYEEERKTLAGRVNDLVGMLPQESLVRQEFVDSTLTLKNGNLQNKWDSQIRNISSSIGEISNIVEPVGAQLSEQLSHIAHSLLEYRIPQNSLSEQDTTQPTFTRGFLSAIQSLPDDIPIKQWSEGTSLAPSNMRGILLVGADNDAYAETITELERRQEEIREKYQHLNQLRDKLAGGDVSLSTWVHSFKNNVDGWLHVWSDHPDEIAVAELKTNLEMQINSLSVLGGARVGELSSQIESVTMEGKDIASRLNLAKRCQDVVKDIDSHKTIFSTLLNEPGFTVRRLENHVSNYFEEQLNQSAFANPIVVESETIQGLGKVFEDWSGLEYEKKQDEINATDSDKIELAESLITGAMAICKQESGARSQLLSIIGVIPQAELEQLLENMNQLLASFHFPEDFLPIELENHGTEKTPKWSFKTQSGVKFDDLSTGQKSQLAICWTINLNLALSGQLGHRVIGFDDFTTSLDMNQLIPAAVLLRKLAYADNDAAWKRQVIVTSHHEDLTNRLLDFLLPPAGKSMKVIQFEDWSVKSGPVFKCYNVDMGEVRSDGLEAAVKRVVSSLA